MSEQPYILAIDQGTTSSRAILFDRAGRPVAVDQRVWKRGRCDVVVCCLSLSCHLVPLSLRHEPSIGGQVQAPSSRPECHEREQ